MSSTRYTSSKSLGFVSFTNSGEFRGQYTYFFFFRGRPAERGANRRPVNFSVSSTKSHEGPRRHKACPRPRSGDMKKRHLEIFCFGIWTEKISKPRITPISRIKEPQRRKDSPTGTVPELRRRRSRLVDSGLSPRKSEKDLRLLRRSASRNDTEAASRRWYFGPVPTEREFVQFV